MLSLGAQRAFRELCMDNRGMAAYTATPEPHLFIELAAFELVEVKRDSINGEPCSVYTLTENARKLGQLYERVLESSGTAVVTAEEARKNVWFYDWAHDTDLVDIGQNNGYFLFTPTKTGEAVAKSVWNMQGGQ